MFLDRDHLKKIHVSEVKHIDKISISIKAKHLLNKLIEENQEIHQLLKDSKTYLDFATRIQFLIDKYFSAHPHARAFYKGETKGREAFEKLSWSDFAAIRMQDYLTYAGREYEDLNLRGAMVLNDPFRLLWLAWSSGSGGVQEDFFHDMRALFRQFYGKYTIQTPKKEDVQSWMDRHPSGLDSRIQEIREENKKRILNIIIRRINSGEIRDKKFFFEEGMDAKEKYKTALQWWDNHLFHLRFAIRSPEMLNEMLDYSLDTETMKILYRAKEAGIPFFVNPYYLSLLNVREPSFAPGCDLAIRTYILYTRELIDEFGHIVAWEKEDIVEPGKPNAAGWILPVHHNLHRRYPEVAILIPDTVGRACGGLCVSCQRMYDFQSGHLNFDLKKLLPRETWPEKLKKLMKYYEEDSQLRDILITGGDSLMSSDASLKRILDEVYHMALRKKEANKKRKNGEKYAEILRVRLGTRLPIYLPQRINCGLAEVLSEFKEKASAIGIKQFVIQTHYESAMEITQESARAVKTLNEAGWIVTNQLVFTAAASRRGHTAKLRKCLNDIGVLPYYTFIVKGYMENQDNFANTARAVQEQLEEKILGRIPEEYVENIKEFPQEAENLKQNISKLREDAGIPFLATDRNVLNLPGVGKSLTYRVIGITRHGRRILEFDHDTNRWHSPIINKMGTVIIIESKTINEYLKQLENMGEDSAEYRSIYGYSIGETEALMPIYKYPDYNFEPTDYMSNLKI